LDEAVHQGYIAINPCTKLPAIKSGKAKIKPPEQEDVERLILALPMPWSLLVELAAYSGLRAGDLAGLRVRHLERAADGRVSAIAALWSSAAAFVEISSLATVFILRSRHRWAGCSGMLAPKAGSGQGGDMGLFTRTRQAKAPTSTVPWEALGVAYQPTIRGESHYQPELRALLQRSQRWTACLQREPNNKFDRNAVSVWIDGQRVAYLARQEAAELASRLDALARDSSLVVFAVTLYGGYPDKPCIGVFADLP
jgi:hypothetical protein